LSLRLRVARAGGAVDLTMEGDSWSLARDGRPGVGGPLFADFLQHSVIHAMGDAILGGPRAPVTLDEHLPILAALVAAREST
jgi:hypothetical protein